MAMVTAISPEATSAGEAPAAERPRTTTVKAPPNPTKAAMRPAATACGEGREDMCRFR